MTLRSIAFAAFAVLVALAPVRATDTRTYARGEYAIIRDGLAPSKELSLAAHGDGEDGGTNFHIWLMAEPAHRKLASLDDIGDNNNLDTGPDAYQAFWSQDSRRVAVSFRSDRHDVELNIYAIDGRHARLVGGPTLFKNVAGRDVGSDDDLRRSLTEIEWHGNGRFVLRERRIFMTEDAGFAGRLGAYGRLSQKLDDRRLLVEFSAEADCVLAPRDRYRVVDLRAGKFED